MKRKMKRLLGILLSLVLILGLTPGMSLTALAWEGNPYESLKNTTTVIKFDNKDWYLIEDESTAVNAGTVTLLAKDCVRPSAYNGRGSGANYTGSTVEGIVNTWYAGNISEDAKTAVSGGKMFLLTIAQANAITSVDVRKCSAPGTQSNVWWLCSPGTNSDCAAVVSATTGNVNSAGKEVYKIQGVRPALKLDLEFVKFSSGTNTFKLKSAHEHSFSFELEGATITATCGNDGCELTEKKATISIVGAGPNGAKLTGNTDEFDNLPTITYYETNTNHDDKKDSAQGSTTAPTAVGWYWAEFTLGSGENTATAHVIYEVPVAVKIGATEYTTLKAAIDEIGNATEETVTIQLQNDIEECVTFNTNKTVTLDLNGHTIDGDQGTTAITISNGTLILNDTSEAKTGEITGAKQGVAVNGGTFIMNDGVIQGNIGNINGAGVSVANGATFKMISGAIQYNQTSTYTGGVLLNGGATFIMSGGAIQYNSGAANGFGGIGSAGAEPQISGTAVVKGNVMGGTVSKNEDGYSLTGGTPCDYRNTDKNKKIKIIDSLTTGAKIGVFDIYNEGVAFTSGYNTYNSGVKGSKYFFSDDDSRGIHNNNDGELFFGDPLSFILLEEDTKPVITVKRGETAVTSGAPQIDDVLTVETDATDLVYEWYLDDDMIDGQPGSTYTITAGDLGKKISVKVYQTKDGTGDELTGNSRPSQTSAATEAVEKKTNNKAKIDEDTLSGSISKTNNSITIGVTEGTEGYKTSADYEYAVVVKNTETEYNWTNPAPRVGNGGALNFGDLNPGTDYDVYVRAMEYDDFQPGKATMITVTTHIVGITIGGSTATQGQAVNVTLEPSRTGVIYKWYISNGTTSDGVGTTVVPSTDGTLTKVEAWAGNPLSLIGETETNTSITIQTLAGSISTSPATITLDGPVKGDISIPENKTVTLDIKGQEIDGGISVPTTSILTINDSSNPQTGTVKGTVAADTGTVIIKGGKYEYTPTGSGTKTIKGGLFKEDPKNLLNPPYEVKESGDNTYTHEVYNAYTALTADNAPTISITKADGNTDGDTPQIGDTLTASTTAKPVSYQWYRKDAADSEPGTQIRSGSTYTLTSDDAGKVITVKATQAAGANDNDDNPSTVQTQTSTATAAVEKKTNPKIKITDTAFLEKITKTGTSITITSDSNYEYAVVPKSETTYDWTNPMPTAGTGGALTFGDNEQLLSPGTDYDVYVRAKAYDDYQPGEATKIIVSTDVEVMIGGTPEQGQAVNVTLTPNKGGVTYKWYIVDGGTTTFDGEGETIVPSTGGKKLKVEVYAGDPKSKIGEVTTEANIKTFAEVINAMEGDSVTITLAGKITGNIEIPAGKNVELNLNGQTVTGNITVPATSTLTIKDDSSSKEGTVTGTVKSETGAVTIISGRYDSLPTKTNGGSITIEGGIFKVNPSELLTGTNYGIKELTSETTYKYKVLLNPTISSEPQALQGDGLTYTGSAQALVTKPTVQNGTMYYAVVKSNTQPDQPVFDGLSEETDKKWTTSVPTAKEVGTYYVWYRVIGDATHADSNVVSLGAIRIKPGAPKVTDLRADAEVFDYTTGILRRTVNIRSMLIMLHPTKIVRRTKFPMMGLIF